MTRFLFCLFAGIALATPAHAGNDAWLTAPADPALGGRPTHYDPVTAGLNVFRVVEPKDWRDLNRAAAGEETVSGKDGGSMPGMDHGGTGGGGMPGMKGMDHGGMKPNGRRSRP